MEIGILETTLAIVLLEPTIYISRILADSTPLYNLVGSARVLPAESRD
jgi:hypothetical protein